MQVYLQLPRRTSYMWPSGQIYSIDATYVRSGCEITACGKIQYQSFDHHRQKLKTTAIQLGRLKPVVRNGISTVCYQPQKNAPNRLVIYMRDGNTVYANLTTVDKKMAYYPAIAATMKEPGVVDLQVGAFSYSYKSREQ